MHKPTAKPIQENPSAFGPFRGILLLGGGQLLRLICKWAIEQSIRVEVITSPRHAREKQDDITLHEFLSRLGVRFVVSSRLNTSEVRSVTKDNINSLAVSLGAAWIVTKKEIQEMFGGKLFNLHGTRLPQNRGAGGFSWQILSGNRLGYCMLHEIDGGIDTGKIWFMKEFIYPPACRIPCDFEKVYVRNTFIFFCELFKDSLENAVPQQTISQPEYLSTYWPRLSTELNGWIDWNWTAQHIEQFICAFDDPYCGASTFLRGARVFLKKTFLNTQDGCFHPYQAGLIYRKSSSWICVSSIGGGLIIKEIFDLQGRNIIDTLNLGDRFETFQHVLDNSRCRVNLDPSGKFSASRSLTFAG